MLSPNLAIRRRAVELDAKTDKSTRWQCTSCAHRTSGVDVLLVSSGLGPGLGGIGRASQSIQEAIRERWRVAVVTAPPEGSRLARRVRLWHSLLASLPRRPRLVVYEHRGLAMVHRWIPWSRRTRHAIFMHGFELWHALAPSHRRVIEAADCLLANSQTTVDEARRHNPWLPPARIVHLGVDLPVRAKPASRSSPLLVLVGRVDACERFKGHDEILDAWPAILNTVPTARFVAIGGGSDVERLRARVRSERLDGVEFTGFVSTHERDQWLDEARAAFALGRAEGFGLANVEAAGVGLPLIGLPNTVLEELFPAGAGVRFVRSLLPADIAEAAIELLREPERAAELGARGRAHVLSNYTQDHFKARFLATLGPVIES
jgi:phosphatidylinositol alpha-1,6-mannosyltransferase